MQITNNSKAQQAVRVGGKAVYLKPGETRDLRPDNPKRVQSLPFFSTEGEDAEDKTAVSTEAKSIPEVLALADDGTHFKTFEAEAKKILGDATPATKDEIIAALKAKQGVDGSSGQ